MEDDAMKAYRYARGLSKAGHMGADDWRATIGEDCWVVVSNWTGVSLSLHMAAKAYCKARRDDAKRDLDEAVAAREPKADATPTIVVGSRWRHRFSGGRMTVTGFWDGGVSIAYEDGRAGATSRDGFHDRHEPDDVTPSRPDSTTPGHDPVNHPAHYTSHPARCECGAGIECITIARNCNFCVGNAIKYLWRAGLKGDAIEDLRKAAWYINDEIARLEKEATR